MTSFIKIIADIDLIFSNAENCLNLAVVVELNATITIATVSDEIGLITGSITTRKHVTLYIIPLFLPFFASNGEEKMSRAIS